MSTYFVQGLEISTIVSLAAGFLIGVPWGIAGLTSAWLFVSEMLAVLCGGALILFVQLLLAAIATASHGMKAGALLSTLFLIAEPAFPLIAMCTAIAVAFLLKTIRSNLTIFFPRCATTTAPLRFLLPNGRAGWK
jgi:hypothetical protein